MLRVRMRPSGFFQGGVEVARQRPQRKQPEEVGICPDEVADDFDIPLAQRAVAEHQASDGFHLWKIELQRAGDLGRRHRESDGRAIRRRELYVQAIGPVRFGECAIEAVFLPRVQRDEQRRRETDREAQDIDRSIRTVAEQTAKRGGEVVAEHATAPTR